MSRRRGENGITGPSSALTSFLRDQGIDTRPLNTWRRREQVNLEENAEAGPSQAQAGPSNTNPSPARNASGYNSDNLDSEEDEDANKSKKKKKTKAELAKEKAKAKAKAAAAKKRKRGGKEDDDFDEQDDDDEEEEDEYTAPSKGAAAAAGKAPDVGSFENCAECGKRFTVTKYTVARHPPPGYLCHPCAKTSGNDPFKKLPAPKKRKVPDQRKKPVNFEDTGGVQSLTDICIEIIGEHINDVESLGNSGNLNNGIAKIICKNRKLTQENVQLFYNVQNTDFTLTDATALLPPALTTLAALNPNIQRLRLDLCGRMDNSVVMYYGSHLKNLVRIELLGPFLVRPEGWLAFFEAAGPQLEGFLITQSPRFDRACLDSLVQHAGPTLTELRLAEVGLLCDEWLPVIATLSSVTYLDLAVPSGALTDDGVIEMLKIMGNNLIHLNLSGHEQLTDRLLTEGIAPHLPHLDALILSTLGALGDEAVSRFFADYEVKRPLSHIDLTRNPELGSDALGALLAHSGAGLAHLSINGWKETSTETLMGMAKYLPKLVTIDIGWCRAVDDFVIKSLLEECPALKVVKCYGCNRVTDNCPRKRGVAIFGVETHAAT